MNFGQIPIPSTGDLKSDDIRKALVEVGRRLNILAGPFLYSGSDGVPLDAKGGSALELPAMSIVTNANGTAILYTNGWQECWARLAPTATGTSGSGTPAHYFADCVWTYPSPFKTVVAVDPGSLNIDILLLNDYAAGFADTITTKSARVVAYGAASFLPSLPAILCHAVGYWR